MPTCPACKDTFSPNGGGHCRACCRTFTSDSSFDAHRRGPYSDRHCLPVESLSQWRSTPRGWTPHPEWRPAQ